MLVTTFNYLISLTGGLQSGELLIFDRFIQMRPPQPVEQRIVVIAIDEQDIQDLQEYPRADKTVFLTSRQSLKTQLKQTIELLLLMGKDRPAASKIALEFLKQGESNQNKAIINKLIDDGK